MASASNGRDPRGCAGLILREVDRLRAAPYKPAFAVARRRVCACPDADQPFFKIAAEPREAAISLRTVHGEYQVGQEGRS
jgi:hypothetical protein